MSSCRNPSCAGAHGEGGTTTDPDHVVIHSHGCRTGRDQPTEDLALRPLASFLDRSSHHVFGYRLGGAWYLRVAGVTGTGRTFAEASAAVCNALFAADHPEQASGVGE